MRHILYFLCFVTCTNLLAQSSKADIQNRYQCTILPAVSGTMNVDGLLDESAWQAAEMQDSFWLKWPRDGGAGTSKTTVRLTHDDKMLYVGVELFGTNKKVIQSLKRDVAYWDSDGFAIVLDPQNQGNNGYFFGVNTEGVQTDALISSSSDDMDANWDNVWFAEVQQQVDKVSIEMAIPLRILRFKEGSKDWGVNFIRNDLAYNEYTSWVEMPLQLNGTDLGWTGLLSWQQPPASTKRNVNLVPYVSSGMQRDFEANEPWSFKPNAGIDAKIGVGSGLNLDVTINPDFSQIEVDEQVVNLTRFSIFLPEKRTFFLENADIFGRYGIPPVRPFFSRRIGLDADGGAVPILYGLRLTGNVSPKTRIGVLNMHTGKTDADPSRNFSALSAQHTVFGRSTIAGYFLNRQDFEGSEAVKKTYSRSTGVEWFYLKPDGTFGWWTNYHLSFKENLNSKNGWGNVGFFYNNRNLDLLVDVLQAGQNYTPDLGYEVRISNYDVLQDTVYKIGYQNSFISSGYRFFPKKKDSKLNFSRLGLDLFTALNTDLSFNENSLNLSYRWSFINTSNLSIEVANTVAELPVHIKFDEEENDICPPLPLGRYTFTNTNMGWDSDSRKALSYGASVGGGEFYNGEIRTAQVRVSYRVQPYANFRMTAQWNDLNFPDPYCSVDFFNITPRIEIFFNRKINWTTFVQYNTQADNFNINSRLQWRFRPMSDLFIVFTDNRHGQGNVPLSRGLVAKLNYWW